ncbi:dephospho-CoA kinase [Marmoricola endophyticus]|uniref:Dephospho-CoA kinase n=1 Tax=Marmoricola endophyticus TaxID=2040280 RepID=A0A917BA77_9ACTN|nr:dephospho-CoA kinase [Marmoricola endophyticus]GGF32396.1 dephospho-CoA kinase [Marmoricola endophyticus]
MTRRVGLTGGVASGKSTVAALLAEHGAVVIDADVLAREVVAAGTPGLSAVVESFGQEVLADDGELDRPAMGRLVFADEGARKRLEGIVHPLVHARIAALEHEAGDTPMVVHDIPLLAEGGAERRADFDAVLVVDVPEQLQVDRMVRDRGWEEGDARARIAAQASREERLAIATHVIDNTGTRDDLRDRVAEVVEELQRSDG